MKPNKLTVAFDNFELALSSLQKFVSEAKDRDLDRSGVIKGFEFTYEISWKYLQKLAENDGLKANSPRDAFKFAFQKGLVKQVDESIWLKMLDDRNLTVHTYDVDLSKEIFNRIKSKYVEAFVRLRDNILLQMNDSLSK